MHWNVCEIGANVSSDLKAAIEDVFISQWQHSKKLAMNVHLITRCYWFVVVFLKSPLLEVEETLEAYDEALNEPFEASNSNLWLVLHFTK